MAGDKTCVIACGGTRTVKLPDGRPAGRNFVYKIAVDYVVEYDPLGDPLGNKYDGMSLRALLALDEARRRETAAVYFTSAQRAAISAHWSAKLRLKTAT